MGCFCGEVVYERSLSLIVFYFFSFLIFFPKCCQMCTFFAWLENVIFLLVIHVFWWGYFFCGARRVPPVLPMILARRRRKTFRGNISLKKKNTSLEIANSLSCEHVSELSNGRQLCTFLGFFFLSCSPQAKKIFRMFLLVLLARRWKKFWGFVLFQKAASYTHFGI